LQSEMKLHRNSRMVGYRTKGWEFQKNHQRACYWYEQAA